MSENVSGAAKRPHMDEQGENSKRNNVSKEVKCVAEAIARAPFDASHRLVRASSKFHLLIGITGSVATIKLTELVAELYRLCPKEKLSIKPTDMNEVVYEDRDEWSMWQKRGDPVLHIELRRWADAMLIAPLDANTLAKVANGICDNLLTSVVRAWDAERPLFFAPAMNTCMWDNPLTYQHLKTLKELLQYKEIPPMEKELMCGDKGYGAMAPPQMIASIIAGEVRNKFTIYSVSQ